MPQVNAMGAKNQCQKQQYQSVALTVTLFSSEFLQEYKLLSYNYLVLITSSFQADSSQTKRVEGHVTVARFRRPRQFEGEPREYESTGGLGKISPSLFNNVIFWPKGFDTFSLMSSLKALVILKREGRCGSTCWHVHPSCFRLLPCSCRDLASAHCHMYAKSPFAPLCTFIVCGQGGVNHFQLSGNTDASDLASGWRSWDTQAER